MTVMLGVTLFCVFSFLLLIIFDNGCLFGTGCKTTPNGKNSGEKQKGKDSASLYGKYVATSKEEVDEYFELYQDGKATIFTVDNNAPLEISTRFTEEKNGDTTVIKFQEYADESPTEWYTFAIEITGSKALPSGYSNNCKGQSPCDISFEK